MSVEPPDGAPARVPLPAKVLEDDRGGDRGVFVQHARHGVPEPVAQRGRGGSPVLGRLGQAEQKVEMDQIWRDYGSWRGRSFGKAATG
jgi:hypothetical protein